MTKLTASYSAFGQRPFPPVREAIVQGALQTLRDTAADYRTEAAMKARIPDAEAAEAARWAADMIDMVIPIIAGGAPKPEETPPKPEPQDHRCDSPGCGESAAYGFGIGHGPRRWACGAHREQVGKLWRQEQDDREKAAAARRAEVAEAMKPKTDLSGVKPGNLI